MQFLPLSRGLTAIRRLPCRINIFSIKKTALLLQSIFLTDDSKQL